MRLRSEAEDDVEKERGETNKLLHTLLAEQRKKFEADIERIKKCARRAAPPRAMLNSAWVQCAVHR